MIQHCSLHSAVLDLKYVGIINSVSTGLGLSCSAVCMSKYDLCSAEVD